MITIDTKKQILTLQKKIIIFEISSAKNGLGEIENSFCTPRGNHTICEKIGDTLPINTIFVGRKPTGEIYTENLAKKYNNNRDWILTRILWLDGQDDFNKNSKQRYIYIHGTPKKEKMGIPLSKGCIRLHSENMIRLFDNVNVGDKVNIY